jgi:hypothetical protein
MSGTSLKFLFQFVILSLSVTLNLALIELDAHPAAAGVRHHHFCGHRDFTPHSLPPSFSDARK